MGLAGMRKRGEESMYQPDRDILNATPDLLVKGAAFVVDPQGCILGRLAALGIQNIVVQVRANLDYLLDVLSACRSTDLKEALDETKVNPVIYEAIMLGAGIMLLRKFNYLFRAARMHDVMTGHIDEPIKMRPKAEGLALFDSLVKQSRGDDVGC